MVLKKNLKKILNKKESKKLANYARYSSLAFQMIATMLLGVFGGIELDKWLNLNFPVFTILLTIGSVVLAIYLAIKDFINFK